MSSVLPNESEVTANLTRLAHLIEQLEPAEVDGAMQAINQYLQATVEYRRKLNAAMTADRTAAGKNPIVRHDVMLECHLPLTGRTGSEPVCLVCTCGWTSAAFAADGPVASQEAYDQAAAHGQEVGADVFESSRRGREDAIRCLLERHARRRALEGDVGARPCTYCPADDIAADSRGDRPR